MGNMTPHVELGVGILLGAIVVLFIVWATRVQQTRMTYTSADSAETLKVARRILEEIDMFCLILDETGNPVYANHAAREYDGSTDLDRLLRQPRIQSTVFRVLATGEPYMRDPKRPDAPDAVSLRIAPLDDYHVVVFAADQGEAQRVHALRRDFIANMSHELKTPIAAIGLLSEAIGEASDDPAMVKNFAEKLGAESRRLGELSRDVIRLSEAQASLSKEARERIDLRELVVEQVEQHTELASGHGVSMVLEDNTRKPQETVIFGRRSAIGVAVANLITNAIAYSPEGGEVRVVIGDHDGAFAVSVSDDGPGIDPEFQSRIFERFFRVDEGRSRKLGGSGLGLSIVRNTMRAHGGDVTVRSVPGEGATFELSFPLALSATMRKKKKTQKNRVDRARQAGQATHVKESDA